MKIETHAHSSKASICADVTDEQIIQTYKSLGYDGLILTNHINWAWNKYPETDHEGRVQFYLDAFTRVKRLGEQNGLKVFLGAEVATITESGVHQEFLLVGFDKEFLLKNDLVYTVYQKELFDLANKNGLFMWQSHPFRTGEEVGDYRYMHGAEAFNAHFHHDNYNLKAKDFCLEHGLTQMSGSDYHHADQPVLAGIIVPDDIENEKQLAQYLLNTQPRLLTDMTACLKAREDYLNGRKEKV